MSVAPNVSTHGGPRAFQVKVRRHLRAVTWVGPVPGADWPTGDKSESDLVVFVRAAVSRGPLRGGSGGLSAAAVLPRYVFQTLRFIICRFGRKQRV